MTRSSSLRSRLLVVCLSAVLFFVIAPSASAQGIQVWDGSCVIDGVATIQGLGCMIRNILGVTITFIGLAAFVMLLIGAFRLLLSGGNSKATEDARNIITFSVVGIVVALAAFIIINLISSFTGVDQIKNFNIPESGTGALSV